MHKTNIPQRVIDRVIAARGSAHVYDRPDPRKTALLVIDLQNAFMMEGVAHNPVPGVCDIVPNVNRLAATLREGGGTIVWIKHTYRPELIDDWSVFHDDLSSSGTRESRNRCMEEGSLGHQLWSGLEVNPTDLIVAKTRFSAFIQGSSDLEPLLRARDIDTVIITGTVTGTCCESTARDAMMRNFKVIMVSDANAARSDEDHNMALIAVYTKFGDLLTTDEVIAGLQQSSTMTGG